MAIKTHTALAKKYEMSELDIAKLAKKMPKRKIGYVRLAEIGYFKNRNGRNIPLHGFFADEERFNAELMSLSGISIAIANKAEEEKVPAAPKAKAKARPKAKAKAKVSANN